MAHKRLYIIHAILSDGSLWHYIGITAQKTVSKRLQQHRDNARAPERKEKLATAQHVEIRAIHNSGSTAQESFLHSCPEWFIRQEVCPVCRGIPEGVQTQIEPDFSAEPDPLLGVCPQKV